MHQNALAFLSAALVVIIGGCRIGAHSTGDSYADETGFEVAFPEIWRDSIRVSPVGEGERSFFWPQSERVVEFLYEPLDETLGSEPLARIIVYPAATWARRADAIILPGSRLVGLDSAHVYVFSAPRMNPYDPRSHDADRFQRFAAAGDTLRASFHLEKGLQIPEPPTAAQRIDAVVANPGDYVTVQVGFEMGDTASNATGFFRGERLILIDEHMDRGDYGETREQYLSIDGRLFFFRRTGIILWHDIEGQPDLREIVAEISFSADGVPRVLRYDVGGSREEIREIEIDGIVRHYEYLRDRILEEFR